MTINELLTRLDRIAPFGLALKWDKTGLQIGNPGAPADKVLLTLDITQAVVDHAQMTSANVIISHHPLIFRSLESVTDPLLLELIENRIAVIAMHTNLDCAPDGVNHHLAKALGLNVIGALSQETGTLWHHLSVTVPPDAVDAVRSAAFNAGAGRIGHYESCSTCHGITGSFIPQSGSQPYIGSIGSLETVSEVELEMMVDSFRLTQVIAAINSVHPYETPALYHYPVTNHNPAYAQGLICGYDQDRSIAQIIEVVKSALGNPHPHVWLAGEDIDTLVGRIAICGGAAGSMIRMAAAGADILIGGELTYHNIIDSPIPLIDAGHFWTEYPVLDGLSEKLRESGLDCSVFPRRQHEYCLRYLQA